MKKNHTESKGKKLILGIILLLLAVSLFFYRDAWRKILEGLRQVSPAEITVSSFFAVSAYFIEGMTVLCLMSTVIPRASAPEGIRIAFLCEFYRLTTLGNGAGIAEIHYMRENGIETGNAALLTMFQYMGRKLAILALGSCSFLALSLNVRTRGILKEYDLFIIWGFLGTIAIIVAFCCLIFSRRIVSALNQALDWLSGKFPSHRDHFLHWEEQILLLNQSGTYILSQKRKMFFVFLFQVQKLLLFYCIPTYLLLNKGSLRAAECIALMALTCMVSGVIPAPSGIGSLEFIFLLFFGKYFSADLAVAAILVYRFATWIVPFLVGSMVALLSLVRRRAAM